jgi:enoyl-CoA hydratase/carnithine racemase
MVLARAGKTRMQQMVTYELRGAVAWIGLNRPEKRNAISAGLLASLDDAAHRAQAEARAMVVFGHGPVFCAGLDLAEHKARDPVQTFETSRAWHAAFGTIRRGRVPAIAALHGATVGGGLELASPATSAWPTRPPSSPCRRACAASMSAAAPACTPRGCSAPRG